MTRPTSGRYAVLSTLFALTLPAAAAALPAKDNFSEISRWAAVNVPDRPGWLLVATGSDSAAYVNLRTYPKPDFPIAHIWYRIEFVQPKHWFKEPIYSALMLVTVNCETQQYRFEQTTYFGEHGGGGSVVHASQDRTASDWKYAAPDTLTEEPIAWACNLEFPLKTQVPEPAPLKRLREKMMSESTHGGDPK